MDLFESKYPIIRNIYYDFQNSEEYNKIAKNITTVHLYRVIAKKLMQ